MKIVIDIPKDFEGDYIADKFKDFFSRVIADINCKGMCGRYEKEIAEMFLKAFDDSEEKFSCNYQHNCNSRDSESRQTNADRIRNMSDKELAEWINTKNMCEQCANYYEPDSECMGEPCASNILRWLQSEAE